MGNLRSVTRAWETVGAAVRLVADPAAVGAPDALVFPGQGAIVDAMRLLRATGWDRLIRDWIAADRPFFGICLGLQALFEHSEEGDTPGLGIFPGAVRRFAFPAGSGLKVPHMGWNAVRWTRRLPVDADFAATGDQFYFVHSYYAAPADPALIWGETDYGDRNFCAAVARGRLCATQFHPEKSQTLGLRLYRNFVQGL
jgi:glutamine amidotransferase